MADIARPQRRPVRSLGIKNDLGSCCRHIAPPCAQIYADGGLPGPVSKAWVKESVLSIAPLTWGAVPVQSTTI
jgi:hypothetical protein